MNRFTKFIDSENTCSEDYTTKYHFSYNDNEDYADIYGRLYTWAAAVNGVSGNESELQRVQGVCPSGWHVPGDDEWQVLEIDGIKRLRREFKFPDFIKAIAFTNAVADIAEAEQHHPEILTEWGRVTVTWWTHTIRGLHKNDFIMAARTDRLLEAREPSLDS